SNRCGRRAVVRYFECNPIQARPVRGDAQLKLHSRGLDLGELDRCVARNWSLSSLAVVGAVCRYLVGQRVPVQRRGAVQDTTIDGIADQVCMQRGCTDAHPRGGESHCEELDYPHDLVSLCRRRRCKTIKTFLQRLSYSNSRARLNTYL